MNKPVINGRFLHQRITGVQRYGREILKEFDRGGYDYEVLEPGPAFSGGKLTQHVWEQLLLPFEVTNDHVLWSPTNSGPVFAPNHTITLHDIGIFPHPEWFSASYKLWKRTLIPLMARRAQKIITVSHFSKQVICDYLKTDPKKVHVVYNGVDRERFKPADTATIQDVLEKYSISQPYLLTLGSMDPRKNFASLIKAWNICIKEKKVTGYRLVIAGGTNDNFNQFELNDPSSTVKFLGYIDDDDLAPLYSGAEGFLFPSLFEGFGLPVVEAMACGTPVLTSNSTALKEVAADAAVTVSPENIRSIAEGIMQLLDAPAFRHTLIERGLERAKKFSWTEAASQIYHHLNS